MRVWVTTPYIGDGLALRRIVRYAIERAQAMDIPEADKRVWIANIEVQCRAASRPTSCTRVATWVHSPQFTGNASRLAFKINWRLRAPALRV